MPLTPKQERFAEEYLVDLNATQAAIRAGYSAATAYSQGERLLRNVEIQKAVSAGRQTRSEKTGIDASWVLAKLRLVAERCMEEEQARDKEGNPIGDFVFNAAGANKSLELLGRHLGMFVDKIDIKGSIDIADQLTRAKRRANLIPSAGFGAENDGENSDD